MLQNISTVLVPVIFTSLIEKMIVQKSESNTIKTAQLARHQLSRSHNSVTFTRVDTQDYVSDTCDSVSLLTVVG